MTEVAVCVRVLLHIVQEIEGSSSGITDWLLNVALVPQVHHHLTPTPMCSTGSSLFNPFTYVHLHPCHFLCLDDKLELSHGWENFLQSGL